MAVQTKTFTQLGDKGFSLKLVLTEESTSVSSNTSIVSYEFSIVRGPNQGFYASAPFSWNIVIGDNTIPISGFTFNLPSSNPDREQLIKSGKVTVIHNADGSKTMGFDVSTPDASGISSTWGPKAIRMTGTWDLTTIPRASTISVGNANIGSYATIKIYRASSTFTHTLTYSFAGDTDKDTGVIVQNTANTSYSWPVPTDFYYLIPNSKSGVCTVTCTTYSGGTVIGKPTTATFSVVAGESECRPSVSGTVEPADELSKTLTGSTTKLIKYVSTARATITATAKNGATISNRTVNGVSLTSTKDFPSVSINSFVFSATDSRGYTNSQTKTAEGMVNYTPITLTANVSRVTQTGDKVNINLVGNYWDGNFGAVSNTLELSYQYKSQSGSWSSAIAIENPTISADAYSVNMQISGFEYQKSYDFRLVAKDKTRTLTQDINLSRGVPVFDWGKDDFNVNVQLNTRDINSSGSIKCAGTLILSKTTDASGTADNGPALIVGGTRTTAHMEMDSNEILAKSDGVTPAILNLNTNGGLVVVGSGGLQLNGVASDRIIVTTTSGKLRATTNITTTELNYLDGVTSNIQTQLNGKLSGSSAFAKLIYGGTISQNGTKTVDCGFTPQFCTYFCSSANNAAPWVGGAINFGKNGQEFRIYTNGSAYQRFTCSRTGNSVKITKTGSDTVTLYLYAHR